MANTDRIIAATLPDVSSALQFVRQTLGPAAQSNHAFDDCEVSPELDTSCDDSDVGHQPLRLYDGPDGNRGRSLPGCCTHPIYRRSSAAFAGHRHAARQLLVIMPIRNNRWTLRDAIARVLDAPVPLEIEVLAIDDASTDGSWITLSEIAAAYPRVRAMRHWEPRGEGAAIRTAIEHMSGDVAIVQTPDLDYDSDQYRRPLGADPRRQGRCGLRLAVRGAGSAGPGLLARAAPPPADAGDQCAVESEPDRLTEWLPHDPRRRAPATASEQQFDRPRRRDHLPPGPMGLRRSTRSRRASPSAAMSSESRRGSSTP